MNSNSGPDRHRWLSSNSMMVAAKLATSFKPNWKNANLGDIAEKISTGTTPPSQERRYYDGDINWFTPADIGGNRWLSTAKKSITKEAVDEKKARIFDAGSILITCIGHIGRVGILSKTSSANQQITGIKFNATIDPEFAYYGLFARQDELQAATPTASTLSILNQNRLSKIEFCFPSLGEQIQISKFLSWYEDRIVNRQPFTNDYPTLPDYLSDLPRIVERVEIIASRVAKAQSLREESDIETDALWQSALHRIFDEYQNELKILNEYTTFITDGTHVTPNYVDKGVPFVTVRNIANRKLSFANLKYITPEQHEVYRKRVKAEYGDVLYTKDGTLGVPCFVDTQKEFSFFVSVAIIKPKHDLLDGRYLAYILDAPQVHEQVTNTKTGALLQHIVIRAIKAINIPIPPLDEQRRIVAYLDSVQARLASLRQLQSETQEELDALLPSVLDKAFRGEL